MTTSVRISAVIPVYRSQAMLPELHRRLVAALEAIGEPFEIILVEDCGGPSRIRASGG